GRPTILYDEIDTVFGPKANGNEDIRGMLNAGHRKGATAGRCVMRGKIVETEELPAYCAVALAGLNDLPDTVMTRAVVIRMKRRSPREKVEPWRSRINGQEAEKLRARLEQWAANAQGAIIGWPDMPEGVEDRNADVWEALLSVADLAGGHWPNTAREAAVAAVADSMEDRESLGVLLLRDMRTVFTIHRLDRISSSFALAQLNSMDEAPWSTVSRDGKALNPRGLSQRLGRYSIKSTNIRNHDGKVAKGYLRVEFVDAWSRYLPEDDEPDEGGLPRSPQENATAATAATKPDENCPVCGMDGVPDGQLMHWDCEQ
ncbi:MAG: DUF3631 domain-containing protein, partial [Mycobacterium sp.]